MANRISHGTLTASTVDTKTLLAQPSVEVLNRGTADIYFTVDGTVPAVGADDCEIAVAGASTVVVPPPGPVTVKLISTGTPAYTVSGSRS